MFTGIVKEVGVIKSLVRHSGVCRISVLAPKSAKGLCVGDSIAINGTCLSAVSVVKSIISFEMIPETQALTNLGKLKIGSKVNMEPSLCLNDRLGGHLVLGHVDGMGSISKRKEKTGELELEVNISKEIRRLLVPKGPITIDGVSLTVGARLGANSFSVYLIPETLKKTTLGSLSVGDFVNIELDYVAKLIRQFYFEK
jgi:riboflavin synthase